MKESFKARYENLATVVKNYRDAVMARKAVAHSSTPMTKMEDGVKKGVTITVAELITVVKTANALNKHVVLETTGDQLVINLVDQYPKIPLPFYSF